MRHPHFRLRPPEAKLISIGAGWQYDPSLRKNLSTQATTGITRLSVFLAIDVPVYRF